MDSNASFMLDIGLEPWYFENPPKYQPFWFEKIDLNKARYWARKQLPTCFFICILYFIFIFLGPIYMKDRKPFKLQKTLVIWNFLLAIFSMVGAVRLGQEFFGLLTLPNGFYRTACVREGLNQPASFWALAFTLSKIAELGDTVFIVLRKKSLSLLHWFHHLSMVYCTFFLFSEGEPISRWSGWLNYSVHSIMYSYYTITALRIRLPKKISMMVTSIQILQFITGLSINLYSLYILSKGGHCARTPNSIKVNLVVGCTYLSLFLRLFYNSYIVKQKIKVS